MVEEPDWQPDEPSPGYLKPRFVLGVVLVAALLALGLYTWGNSGNVVLTPEGEVVSSAPAAESDTEAPPPAATPQSCPDPGSPVELEAAELVSLFAASATGGGFSSLPATDEVVEQVESSAPPVTRMTRTRGFAGEPGRWSTCVVSSWTGPQGPMQSLDVVSVEKVSGADRSDSDDRNPSARTGSSSTTTRKKATADRWEVTSWLRGAPVAAPAQRVATVAFYDSSRSCRNPDRPASVLVDDVPPSERLLGALEELISGTAGRANTASSRVPPDAQVLEAEVANGTARVVLSPTVNDDLSRCEGTAAYEQVHDTAAAIVAETLAPEGQGGDADDAEVVVIVGGEEVTTLAP